MSVEILIHNAYSQVIVTDTVVRKMISDTLSYEVEGAFFARRRIPMWDGRVRFLKKDGRYPTGLTKLIVKMCKAEKIPYKFKDLRTKPAESVDFKPTFDKDPRYYQLDAREVSNKRPRGVYLMGTGAGKTLTSALIVEARKVPTLYVTPDTGLREQAYADYAKWFGDKNVSMSINSDAPIVIENIQSLARKDPKLFTRFKMLMVDEFHHSAADTYVDVNDYCTEAYYRYGFTGTFVRTDGTDMRMHGVLADIIFTKSTSELIEEGFLVRPYITMYRLDLGKMQMSYQEAYKFMKTYEPMNKIVAEVADQKSNGEKKQTLVLVRHKDHGAELEKRIPNAVFVSGTDSMEDREMIKSRFVNKKLRCMIATSIFGEGQDIPSIDALINARCEKTEIQTAQGIGRALRLCPGKDKAEVTDFFFMGQKHLQSHSKERLASYRKESAFVVQVTDRKTPLLFS